MVEHFGVLRPTHPSVVEGPEFQCLEALIPEAVVESGDTERLWIRDARWPGVRVVEMPLSRCLLAKDGESPVRKAVVQVLSLIHI